MTGFELLGWFGTLLYLANYAYLAFYRRWRRPVYFSANGVAALSLVVSSAAIASWQAVGINFFWAAISVWLLIGGSFRFVRVGPGVLTVGVGLCWVTALPALFWQWQWQLAVAIIGWSSTFAFSAAYLLFAARRLTIGPYHLWNAYAAFVLLPQLYLDANWPVLAMEVCWFVISLSARFNLHQPDEPR